jgi:hypothetical protein
MRTDSSVTSLLCGVEVNHDQEGGSSRVRPGHCTTVGLTPTITPKNCIDCTPSPHNLSSDLCNEHYKELFLHALIKKALNFKLLH